MARPKTQKKDIRNPEHYIKKTIALDSKQWNVKQTEYHNSIAVSYEDYLNTFEDSYDGEDFLLQQLAADNLLGWIELIDNEILMKAIQSLTTSEQLIVSLIYHKKCTQEEISKVLGLTQSGVSRQARRVERKIKKFFKVVIEKGI